MYNHRFCRVGRFGAGGTCSQIYGETVPHEIPEASFRDGLIEPMFGLPLYVNKNLPSLFIERC
jgi:hypothetical protein